jgi:hypothetical protein
VHLTVPNANSGPSVVDLVDSTRDDPFLADGTKRELLVRFWYPATVSQGCELAAYTSPGVWSYFSVLVEARLPEVKTNSCLDAPVNKGPHPVVVFTHGYTGTFTDYTFLFEDLASVEPQNSGTRRPSGDSAGRCVPPTPELVRRL